MKIEILKEHKSIRAGLSAELPSFTVLTGVNGSGKTHLFEALADKTLGRVTHGDATLAEIVYLPFNGLDPKVDKQGHAETLGKQAQAIGDQVQALKARGRTAGLRQLSQGIRGVVSQLCLRTGLPLDELDADSVMKHLRVGDLEVNTIFNARFATIFKAYQVQHLDNMYEELYQNKGIERSSDALSEEDFISEYGPPPWEFVDGLLDRLRLPYRVTNPSGDRRERVFDFKLVHKDTGLMLDSDLLSTGEKTLMCLALAVYNANQGSGRTSMLILDEPDAALHPSMSSVMLGVLEKEIVQKQGIPVLISTHSPTTVACAPPQALYTIDKKTRKIKKGSLADVTAMLSHGIPNYKVSIEDRRQVFVESKNDVHYYEDLFYIVSREQDYATTPHFLTPHGRAGSSCADVLEITKLLRDKGNTTVYGLIDWDTTNDPEDQVLVLGHEKRYAIENYIFEPHILGIYLVKKNWCSPTEVGVPEAASYVDLHKAIEKSPALLQDITDAIEAKLGMVRASETDVSVSTLISGHSVNVHRDICMMNGHDYEERCKATWPKLKSVRGPNGGDGALKRDVIEIAINDHPELLSVDIHDLFLQIK